MALAFAPQNIICQAVDEDIHGLFLIGRKKKEKAGASGITA